MSPAGFIDKIEPFHLNELVDYKTQYLSGFLAERYSIPLKEGWNDAKGIIDQRITSGIHGQVHGDVVNIVSVSTDYTGDYIQTYFIAIMDFILRIQQHNLSFPCQWTNR